MQVTLNDGQLLVGRLSTRHIRLKTSIGEFEIDTFDAGELGMVEGKNIKQSDNMIRLWLRNGSEFVGRWEKPSVEVQIWMGGDDVTIQVPMSKVMRLQFRGAAVWPTQAVFRIQTQQGDDFFVDVTKTQMKFGNEMGSFSPFLSEIRQLSPVDIEKKQWRIQLENGTVFIAALQQDELQLELDMGPKKISLPLSAIKQMNRQTLVRPQSRVRPQKQVQSLGHEIPAESGFYSNIQQKASKKAASSQQRR